MSTLCIQNKIDTAPINCSNIISPNTVINNRNLIVPLNIDRIRFFSFDHNLVLCSVSLSMSRNLDRISFAAAVFLSCIQRYRGDSGIYEKHIVKTNGTNADVMPDKIKLPNKPAI